MKHKQYRSFANYVSRVKELRVRAGYTWTPLHELEAREGGRTLSRGQGPPRQSADFCVITMAKNEKHRPALTQGGPVNPVGCIIIATAFINREIEAACAKVNHITFDENKMIVNLRLPVSKTDPTAVGCSLHWGCSCSGTGVNRGHPCPYHWAWGHYTFLVDEMYDAATMLEDEVPLFPNAHGETITKEAIVKTIEILGHRAGEPLVDDQGRRRYGGHSMRISGSRWLAGIGIDVRKIMALARWGSEVVLRYIQTAPVVTIAQDMKQRLDGDAQAINNFTTHIDIKDIGDQEQEDQEPVGVLAIQDI